MKPRKVISIFVLFAIAALAFCLLVKVVKAHDYWDNHEPVDPVTKYKCCGKDDCHPVSEENVSRVEGGWQVETVAGPEIITDEHALPSPDGHFWRCVWGGQTRCFFVPLSF